MGSGASATGGSYYHADLVAEAVERAGLSLERARTLDFGCSSGRVVRVLRAAYPDADLHGCDPIGEAIAWAAENVPGVAFLHQDPDPPLPYPDDRFDVVFAISIWSHFGREAGPAWLAEMARVVRPGGLLVMTTQGWFTLARAAAERSWGPAHLGMVARDLVSSGFHFFPCFGPGGDYGVVGDWGMAYLTLEWLLEHAPGWSIVGYAQGRNEGNQDVVVLRREDAVR
jgi:SAM-dependent methyltransferase